MTHSPDIELTTRAGLPPALRALREAYPREGWPAHANFNGLVSFWMDRHLMFRNLCEVLREDAEALLDGTMDRQKMQARLARYGTMLLQQLHGHHQIEDMHYFPRLVGYEASLARGFDILDKDHHRMDELLEGFAQSANGLLQGQAEPGRYLQEVTAFEGFLLRHLEDEEDLIVPILLKHGAAGLE